MLQPKRTKFRKQMTGRLKGKAHRGNDVDFGDFALQATGRGRVTARQIEAARMAIQRTVKRAGKLYAQAMRRWGRDVPEHLSHLAQQAEADVPARQEAASLVAAEERRELSRAHVS